MRCSTFFRTISVVCGLLAVAFAVAAVAAFAPAQSQLTAVGPVLYSFTASTSTTALPGADARRATAPSDMLEVGNSTDRMRGVEVMFFGTGADNSTATYQISVLERTNSVNASGIPDDYLERIYCSGSITLSTTTGVAAKGATSSFRIADTVTCTPSSYATSVCTAYGSVVPFAFSPADNTEARVFIPDLGNARWIKIYFRNGTTTSMNAFVKMGT